MCRKAMTNACKACGVGFKKEMPSVFHKINDSLWQRLETGEITRDQIHENGGIWFFGYGYHF